MNELLIQYEDMLKAGMHFGRKKTVYNPGMGKYVFTVRDGICIIDLLKTQDELKDAIEFLRKAREESKLILFVSPTKQSQESTKAIADALDMPYVIERWLGGTLTNFKIINIRVKRLEEMERDREAGALDKYTKKERLMFDREISKMQTRFGGLKKLTRMPDIVFVSSLKEGKLAISEAQKMGVRVVAVANTDSNPNGIEHVIPANDRSKKSIDLVIDTIRAELTKK